jgi:MFS family permease
LVPTQFTLPSQYLQNRRMDIPSEGLLSRRYRSLTIAMVCLIALVAFESMAVATAMPTVAEALNGLSLYALSFGATLAASIVGMVAAGQWTDARGPAPALWTGVAFFVCGLLMDGLAPDMVWLLCGRTVQGLGSGAIFVALYVIVGRTFSGQLQPRVFAAFSSAWIVPSLIGPTLSGLIVQHVGWRWVFLGVALLALPALLMLRSGLRTVVVNDASQPGASRSGAPQPGAPRAVGPRLAWATLAATGAGVLHVASQLRGTSGVGSCAVALLGLAISTQRLLPPGTLHVRRGLPSVIALRGIVSAAFFGAEVFIPLLLSREYGLSPMWAGSVLTVGALGWCAGSWYQGNTRRQWSRPQFLRLGMSLILSGIVLLGVVTALLKLYSTTWGAAAMICGALLSWVITGTGMGLTYPSLSVLTLSLSEPSEQGNNSSALQLADAVGIATVLAVEGWVFALLLEREPSAAYLISFAIAGALAFLGLLFSSRTDI